MQGFVTYIITQHSKSEQTNKKKITILYENSNNNQILDTLTGDYYDIECVERRY